MTLVEPIKELKLKGKLTPNLEGNGCLQEETVYKAIIVKLLGVNSIRQTKMYKNNVQWMAEKNEK